MSHYPEAPQQVSEEWVRLAATAGLKARLQGRDATANPFDPDAEGPLHQAWRAGWSDPALEPLGAAAQETATRERLCGEAS